MVGVCFSYTRELWSLNQWDYILTSFHVDEVFVLYQESDILPEDRVISRERPRPALRDSGVLQVAKLIRRAEELPKGPSLVITAPKTAPYLQGDECLHSFVHPKDAIYLFGKDNYNLSQEGMNYLLMSPLL